MNLAARLHEARRLLLETDLSTKQIKDIVNYKLNNSFIEAFHEFFGYYPSYVPRKLPPRKSGD
jgi:transcriptional regulator GlxA family with amidase domain